MKAIKTIETNIVVFIEADELSWWKSMYLAGEAPKASDNRATASWQISLIMAEKAKQTYKNKNEFLLFDNSLLFA